MNPRGKARKSAEKQANPLKLLAEKRGKAFSRKSRGKARKSNRFVSGGSAEKRGEVTPQTPQRACARMGAGTRVARAMPNEEASMRKPIPKKLRFDVLHRDGFRCRYCGSAPPGVVLHLDHVTAHVKGGADTFDNLITACAPCNIGKGVTDLMDSISAGGQVSGLAPARVEFFWTSEWKDRVQYIDRARCIEWPPENAEEWEFRDSEYSWLCRSANPIYSTFGFSGRGFSRHLLVSKIHDLLGRMWLRMADYAGFMDDLLMLAEAGHIPEYAAPIILRASHPETYFSRCVERDPFYEEQADEIAKQAEALFANFLAREHTASQAANLRWHAS